MKEIRKVTGIEEENKITPLNEKEFHSLNGDKRAYYKDDTKSAFQNFLEEVEEKKGNFNDAVRLLNDTKNPNYWIINLMWRFGRYQKYLQLKESALKHLGKGFL